MTRPPPAPTCLSSWPMRAASVLLALLVFLVPCVSGAGLPPLSRYVIVHGHCEEPTEDEQQFDCPGSMGLVDDSGRLVLDTAFRTIETVHPGASFSVVTRSGKAGLWWAGSWRADTATGWAEISNRAWIRYSQDSVLIVDRIGDRARLTGRVFIEARTSRYLIVKADTLFIGVLGGISLGHGWRGIVCHLADSGSYCYARTVKGSHIKLTPTERGVSFSELDAYDAFDLVWSVLAYPTGYGIRMGLYSEPVQERLRNQGLSADSIETWLRAGETRDFPFDPHVSGIGEPICSREGPRVDCVYKYVQDGEVVLKDSSIVLLRIAGSWTLGAGYVRPRSREWVETHEFLHERGLVVDSGVTPAVERVVRDCVDSVYAGYNAADPVRTTACVHPDMRAGALAGFKKRFAESAEDEVTQKFKILAVDVRQLTPFELRARITVEPVYRHQGKVFEQKRCVSEASFRLYKGRWMSYTEGEPSCQVITYSDAGTRPQERAVEHRLRPGREPRS